MGKLWWVSVVQLLVFGWPGDLSPVLKLCEDIAFDAALDFRDYEVEEYFDYAAVLPFCRYLRQLEDDVSSERADDLQLIFEYFSSLSLKPGALAAMARRVSVYNAACPVGLKYLEPGSLQIALDNHRRPKSLVMRPPPTAGWTPSDPAELSWNNLAYMATDLVGTKDYSLIQAAAHRYLMGGERFPQDYQLARKLLERVALEAGNPEALTMLGTIYYLGLGVPRDKETALRMLAIAAFNLKSYNAHNHLGVGILKFLEEDGPGKLLAEEGYEEGLELLKLAMEKEIPLAAYNMVAYELLTNTPVRVRWLLSLSAAVSRGSPVAAHTLAKLTSNELMGIQTCSQAWSLMARSVRDDLWSTTAIKALDERGSSTRLTDLELMRLAAAGVEPAEWGLSQIPQFKEAWAPRLRLLAFSAHLGRAAAQLHLGIASHGLKAHMPMPAASKATEAALAVSDETEYSAAYLSNVLDEWENPTDMVGRFNGDQVAFANYEALLQQRHKWLALDEESSQVNLATAEAVTILAWMRFFGKNVEQNFRDAMIYIAQLGQLRPRYSVMQKIYYGILQVVFSINWALIMMSNREVLALGAVFIAVTILGLLRITFKRLYDTTTTNQDHNDFQNN